MIEFAELTGTLCLYARSSVTRDGYVGAAERAGLRDGQIIELLPPFAGG